MLKSIIGICFDCPDARVLVDFYASDSVKKKLA